MSTLPKAVCPVCLQPVQIVGYIDDEDLIASKVAHNPNDPDWWKARGLLAKHPEKGRSQKLCRASETWVICRFAR